MAEVLGESGDRKLAQSDDLGAFALSGGLFYVNGAPFTRNLLCVLVSGRVSPGVVLSCSAEFPAAEQRQSYCVLSVGRQQVRTENVLFNGNMAEWMFATTFDVMSGVQSREFTVSVWVSRNSDELSMQLLGTLSLDLQSLAVDIFEEKEFPLQCSSIADSHPSIRLQSQMSRHQSHVTEDDFEKLRLIGRGSFGKVFQVRKKVRVL